MACCKTWMLAVQMGVLIGAGAVLGYMDHKRRPVMVNVTEIAPLPPTPAKQPAEKPSEKPAGEPPTDTPPAPPVTTPAPASEKPPVEPAPEPATPAGEQIDPELVKQGHITVEQAVGLFNAQPPAFFLDARRKDVYEAGHVRDAFRMPLDAFKGREPAHFQVMPREETYVVYCEGGNCDESVAVQKQLLLAGYTKVYVMHAGYPAWAAAGHPIQTGPDPIEASEGRP